MTTTDGPPVGITGTFRRTCHVCGVGQTYVDGQRVDSRCPHAAGDDMPPLLPGAAVQYAHSVYTAVCLRCGPEGKAWCWRSRSLAVVRKHWLKHEHHHDIRPRGGS